MIEPERSQATPFLTLRSWLSLGASLFCVYLASGSLALTVGLHLAILAHQAGHYYAARSHDVQLPPPFFLPLPPFGGAVSMGIGALGAYRIGRIKPPSPTARFDIAAAGTLCGFGAICLLYLLEFVANHGANLMIPAPRVVYLFSTEPLLFRALYFLTHLEAPSLLHQPGPMGRAAWYACVYTAFQLAPVGRSDGAAILRGFGGRVAFRGQAATVAVTALMGALFWEGWFFVALAMSVLVVGYRLAGEDLPEAESPIGPIRRKIAGACLGVLLACLPLVPLDVFVYSPVDTGVYQAQVRTRTILERPLSPPKSVSSHFLERR